jgi:hypothetical protein
MKCRKTDLFAFWVCRGRHFISLGFCNFVGRVRFVDVVNSLFAKGFFCVFFSFFAASFAKNNCDAPNIAFGSS